VLFCFRSTVNRVMFQAANGDRASYPNFLVIMTDGMSDNSTQTWIEAMAARSTGMTILAVSIYTARHSAVRFHCFVNNR